MRFLKPDTEIIQGTVLCLTYKGAKGMKDRISLLSENLLELSRGYYKEYKPKKYLFEGEKWR